MESRLETTKAAQVAPPSEHPHDRLCNEIDALQDVAAHLRDLRAKITMQDEPCAEGNAGRDRISLRDLLTEYPSKVKTLRSDIHLQISDIESLLFQCSD